LLKAEPVRGGGEPRPPSWEKAPALAASVPQPAVSELRPPRQPRRTPAGGVPAGGVLHALINTPGAGRPPDVAISPPTPLGPHPAGPPGMAGPGMAGPGMAGPGMAPP